MLICAWQSPSRKITNLFDAPIEKQVPVDLRSMQHHINKYQHSIAFHVSVGEFVAAFLRNMPTKDLRARYEKLFELNSALMALTHWVTLILAAP